MSVVLTESHDPGWIEGLEDRGHGVLRRPIETRDLTKRYEQHREQHSITSLEDGGVQALRSIRHAWPPVGCTAAGSTADISDDVRSVAIRLLRPRVASKVPAELRLSAPRPQCGRAVPHRTRASTPG